MDAFGVDGDVACVFLDGEDELGAEPRDVGEESGAGYFAGGEVDEYFVGVDFEAFSECADVGGEEGDVSVADQGESDFGSGGDVAGEGSDGLSELGGEDAAGDAFEHGAHLVDHAAHVHAVG